ncbi:MAG: hypothetical protein ACYDEV_15090 [Acidiferrobacter sp.]
MNPLFALWTNPIIQYQLNMIWLAMMLVLPPLIIGVVWYFDADRVDRRLERRTQIHMKPRRRARRSR